MFSLGELPEPFPIERFWPKGGIARDMDLVARYDGEGLRVDPLLLAHDYEPCLEETFVEMGLLFDRVREVLRGGGADILSHSIVDMHLQNVAARPLGAHCPGAIRFNAPHLVCVAGAVELLHYKEEGLMRLPSDSVYLAESGDVTVYQYTVKKDGPSFAFVMQAPVALQTSWSGEIISDLS